jgi:hypothetical protein
MKIEPVWSLQIILLVLTHLAIVAVAAVICMRAIRDLIRFIKDPWS